MNGDKPMGRGTLVQAAIGLMLFSTSCTLVPNSWKGTTRGFEVIEFWKYTQYPGVESNLYATDMHRLEIMATFPEGAEAFELWVDSVSLPARIVDDRYAMARSFDGKTRHVLQFSASRHRYRQGSPDAVQLPEAPYAASSKVLEGGEALLVFVDHRGRQIRWPLGVPEQRPNRHAP